MGPEASFLGLDKTLGRSWREDFKFEVDFYIKKGLTIVVIELLINFFDQIIQWVLYLYVYIDTDTHEGF